jgi:LAO/AO transport system kinase
MATTTSDAWVEQIRRGAPRAIARAISVVENGDAAGGELLRRLAAPGRHATAIGITGAPGSGKSTLVDALITALRKRGRTVGVLAVDPSSPITGGALLGDRVRMQTHAGDSGVFIRSMATRGALGGVAKATLAAAAILDAAGKEFILIETVGVGQGEVAIAEFADVTLLVLVPGMGDDVQTLKAGVMEIADIFVLNKSDLPGADYLEQEVQFAIGLAPRRRSGKPPAIVRTVASEGKGVDELLAAINAAVSSGPAE